MLTPLDLNGKTFSKGFRGYDTDEVNQFFSQISRDYERLYQDNVELKDSVERVSSKLEYYQRMESTMQSTLVVAQETADEVKKSSRQKAEMLTRETELACNKQKESVMAFCNKLRADTEAEITRLKSEADAYAEKIRKQADEYAARTRSEADDYGKFTRTDADSYATGLRSKTDSTTSKLKEEAQSFVDKMKSLAEIEVAKMKVAAEDNCKSQLADSREQARTLTAEASAHANQVIAEANQQSQNIVAEASQKAHEMIANAQKQSQDMMAEARQKSQDMMAEANQKSQEMITKATEQSRNMVAEATERSRNMVYEATERSQKMVFVAETKAAAAMDTYKTMVNKANSQSKQLKSLLQSQLSLYDNFDAEFAVEDMVQPKLQALKKAEPVLEANAQPADTEYPVKTNVTPLKADSAIEEESWKMKAEPVKAEPASANPVAAPAAVETKTADTEAEARRPFAETVTETVKEPVMDVPAAAVADKEATDQPKGKEVAEAVPADTSAAPLQDKTAEAEKKALPETEMTGAGKTVVPELAAETKASSNELKKAGEESRKPLFPRFKPRHSMVFNRNGFPRKNADLRIALSELQKSEEQKKQDETEQPEGNKES